MVKKNKQYSIDDINMMSKGKIEMEIEEYKQKNKLSDEEFNNICNDTRKVPEYIFNMVCRLQFLLNKEVFGD